MWAGCDRGDWRIRWPQGSQMDAFGIFELKMLLQDWSGSNPNLVLVWTGLGGVDRSSYLGSCTLFGGHISNEVSSCTEDQSNTKYTRQQWRRWYYAVEKYDRRGQKIRECFRCLNIVVFAVLVECDGRILWVIRSLDVVYWVLGSSL